MIDRLNFYDLYGYVPPGLLLLGVLWLPFGLVDQAWPSKELTSALAALVLAYVAGHILHALSKQAFSVKKRGRHYSGTFLDANDKTFTLDFKRILRTNIETTFGIDLASTPDSDHARRAEAFDLCRAYLIERKCLSYAEQFQGMYAAMRSVTACLVLSGAYHSGWSISFLMRDHVKCRLALGAALLLVGLFWFVAHVFDERSSANQGDRLNDSRSAPMRWFRVFQRSQSIPFWIVAGLLLVAGACFAARRTPTEVIWWSTSALAVGSILLVPITHRAYHDFANQFAIWVYRRFIAVAAGKGKR